VAILCFEPGNALRTFPKKQNDLPNNPRLGDAAGPPGKLDSGASSKEDHTMSRARSKNWPALVVLAGLLVGPNAIAQEKPKDGTAPAQAKPAGAVAAKDATKEPDAPKPRVAVFRLAGPVQETPKEEVFNFGGETGIPLETLGVQSVSLQRGDLSNSRPA